MDWLRPSVSNEDDSLYVKQREDRRYQAAANDWLAHSKGVGGSQAILRYLQKEVSSESLLVTVES